jgi:hypothetical protein
MFVCIHCCLCEDGNFAPHVANKGHQKSMTSEVEEDILDIINETAHKKGISANGCQSSTVWGMFQEQ